MTQSPPTDASSTPSCSSTSNGTVADAGVPRSIPIEIISEEEMAFFEAALAATRSSTISSVSSSPSLFRENARSIRSITALAKRKLSMSSSLSSSSSGCPDIEDSSVLRSPQKKSRAPESLLLRIRRTRSLSVTDFTGSEWCEKQFEFHLLFGKKRINEAMKAGSARHLQLEEEVVKKVKVVVKSNEDRWALKFLNFITGVNQLLFDGLTRELPLIGFADGVPLMGKIDEIRMPEGEVNKNPVIVDTKTRVRDVLPGEPQRRNSRLQLMLYKYLWDSLAAGNFQPRKFFEHLNLNPYHILSEDIRENTAQEGFQAKTLDDMTRYYVNTCNTLLPANDQLLLRYESQKDNSIIGEDQFTYDADLVDSQMHGCFEFWRGEREACYAPEAERWKCRHCQFASVCPVSNVSDACTNLAEVSDPINSPSSPN